MTQPHVKCQCGSVVKPRAKKAEGGAILWLLHNHRHERLKHGCFMLIFCRQRNGSAVVPVVHFNFPLGRIVCSSLLLGGPWAPFSRARGDSKPSGVRGRMGNLCDLALHRREHASG